MQPSHSRQEQILARFIQVSRQHLGLLQPAFAPQPRRRVDGRYSQAIRSLLIAGSLGALCSGSAFASKAGSQSDPAKRDENPQNSSIESKERGNEAHRPFLDGKTR